MKHSNAICCTGDRTSEVAGGTTTETAGYAGSANRIANVLTGTTTTRTAIRSALRG